ncbi:MAG: EVE domain-containing protein [Planctomycetota bacterium]|jgi:predicted RNA-binding protein with PUA-like domain
MAKRYWLFKSEPDVYSLADLKRDKKTYWEGVRNYQARNFLRDDIKPGDEVLYYHSRVKPMAVVGTAKVTKGGYPDPEQFVRGSKYYDAASKKDDPRWFVVEIAYASEFKTPVTLDEIKTIAACKDMVLINRSRLSVQPVTAGEFKAITKRGG